MGEDFLYWLKSRGSAAAGAGPRDGDPRAPALRASAHPHRTPRHIQKERAGLHQDAPSAERRPLEQLHHASPPPTTRRRSICLPPGRVKGAARRFATASGHP